MTVSTPGWVHAIILRKIFWFELGAGEAYEEMYGHATLEWQTPFFPERSPLSLFVDTSGGNGTDHILAGFKLYWGKPKSLIRRHREDALPSTLTDLRWLDTSGYKTQILSQQFGT